MRVLIVEDDAALALFLHKGLELDGHRVESVGDGESALSRQTSSSFDLVLFNLGLPRNNGVDVLVELRRRSQHTALLVLLERSDVAEKVRCLKLGVDDCLMKPFRFHELRARCNALLRRREQFANPLLSLRGIELNRIRREVIREGQRIELTAREFSLLEFLMQRPGQCCSRRELLQEVWQVCPETETNVVDVYVNYLRKKLCTFPMSIATDLTGDFQIETIRGEGYMVGSPKVKTWIKAATAEYRLSAVGKLRTRT